MSEVQHPIFCSLMGDAFIEITRIRWSPRIVTSQRKYYFVHLPATASLKAVVRLAHQPWAIEQQYQDSKPNSGWIISKEARIRVGNTTSRSPPSRMRSCNANG
jgi:hypothetical protein